MRNLEAIVSASGKVQPKRFVNISADTVGRVTQLAVNEGDRIKAGQFLIEVDPRNLRNAVQRTEASLAAAQSQIASLNVSLEAAKTSLKQAEDNFARQQSLWKGGLTTREALERSENDLKLRQADVRAQDAQTATQRLRIQQEQASLETDRYNLSKVRIESPINGIVTKRNIEEGEMVMIGTMNNAGTVLLQIADMSIIEAEVEVDETDIPFVQIGQLAKVKIDAIPDKTFTGKVTEVGNSPIVQAAAGQTGQTATNFKVTVTIDGQIPEVRPGFTCTADVTTATRAKAVAVPIQAMAVRELIYDASGKIVPQPKPDPKKPAPKVSSTDPLPAGQTRKDTEGVFLIKEAKATFIPVKTGIAGDKYFEVLNGLKAGDEVITGPFNSVRDLKEGDVVKPEEPKDRT
jgi:HlyD family secretion protein